jgi:hypothetical protein
MAYPNQTDTQPKVFPSSLLAPADFACLDDPAHATSTGQIVSHHPHLCDLKNSLNRMAWPLRPQPSDQTGTPGGVYRSFHFTQCCVQKGDPL